MEIKNESELDLALAELGGLDATLATFNAEANAEIDRVKQRYQALSVTVVENKPVPLPDRIITVEDAIAKYCGEHKAELMPDPKKKKSKEFTHGEIGWRAKRAGLVDDPSKPDVLRGWINKLITAVIALFGKKVIPGMKALRADRFFSVSVSLNKTSTLDLFKKNQITLEQLGLLGLKPTEEGDELWIKPAVVKVAPHDGQPN